MEHPKSKSMIGNDRSDISTEIDSENWKKRWISSSKGALYECAKKIPAIAKKR